jgi:hypothetical protein
MCQWKIEQFIYIRICTFIGVPAVITITTTTITTVVVLIIIIYIAGKLQDFK